MPTDRNVTEDDRARAIRIVAGAIHVDPGNFNRAPEAIDDLIALGWAPAAKPVGPTEAELRSIVGNVLVNASNYPIGVTTHVLGRDMSKLINATTNALLASDLFESRAQVQAEGNAELLAAVTNWAVDSEGCWPIGLREVLAPWSGLEAGR